MLERCVSTGTKVQGLIKICLVCRKDYCKSKTYVAVSFVLEMILAYMRDAQSSFATRTESYSTMFCT